MITKYLTKRRQDIAILMMPVVMMNIVGTGVAFNDPVVDRQANNQIGMSANFLPVLNTAVNYVQADRPAVATSADGGIAAGKASQDFQIDKVDIGGPGQPEMQAFQSVGAGNMVDLFTGDFSYSLPLLDVGGYPIGLSYRAGASMDEEASWVGLGWNLNPGTIMRNVRGLPDDFNGKDSITKELNTKINWTAGVNVEFDAEQFGKRLKWLGTPKVGIYYNNYTGPGFSASITPVLDGGQSAQGSKTSGIGSVGLDIGFDSKSGFNLNASYDANLQIKEAGSIQGAGSIGLNYNSRAGLQGLQINGGLRMSKTIEKNHRGIRQVNTTGFPMFSSSISFNSPTFTPSINMPATFYGFTFTQGTGGEAWGYHPKMNISGYYNQSYIAAKDRTQKLPAYGYLHMTKSARDPKALLDFNREKDIPYRKNVPNIAVPFQTYDVFSISGEGIGGSFRAYRGDAGIMRDHQVKSKSISGNLGLDFGHTPNLVIGGVDARFTYAYTETRKWEENNVIKQNLVFKESDSTYEAVYFRNPGEQTSNTAAYYQSIGDEDLVRVNLTGNDYNPTASNKLARFNKYNQLAGLQLVNKPVLKINRDKRAQVINYLNAKEAALVGLNKEIQSFPINSYPLGACDSSFEEIARVDGSIRKENHISQVTVLNPDGMQYIYGIPAYNLVQKEATFAVDKSGSNAGKGLVSYTSNDLSTNNNEGKDGYFNIQTTPAYAHSYLLTALLSPGYVDVSGNGITDDDLGDAVKFNYTRMKWEGDIAFKWRTPTDEDKGNYDEGLRTDNSDDKGHITYGEKEIWYLNSIESKTMIATFKLDTDSLRKDGFEVKDINGGRSTNPNKRLMRLKEINLYSKADLEKYGGSARPIKKVVFTYSYRLCKGYPDLQDTTIGKLTLESVRFFYNGSKKGKDNPYIFNYGSNPAYQYKAYDRWGNYKPASSNPGSIPSDEYPYSVKDSTLASQNAGAWALSSIRLPSGALMKVAYESDDYGFVQNKTANEMFSIAGFGTSAGSTPDNNLYQSASQDKRFVFVSVPVHVSAKSDVWNRYLRDQNKLYFKLHVKMPHDSYGSGYEYVPVYADIKNYGRVNDSLIWVELQPSPEGNNKSPLATAAIQFLRLNLPSKAYPGSDVGNDPAFLGAIRAVLSIVGEAKRLLFGGFGNDARARGKSKEVMLSRSFVRLSTPVGKKQGGGYRVKRITIQDNWQKMTGKKESVYGQEYEYTTTKTIGGKKQVISSGVASYEPAIGNEENPFHQPVEYLEKATLAPSNNLYVEEPFGESLFPGAGVGYSKVRVSSINRKNIKSAPGFEESEFYTAYDFPTLTQRTQFDNDSHKKGIDKFVPFALRTRKFITISQGFKLELNDMHGKPKSSAVFAETDPVHPISYTAQYYRSEKIGPESYKLINTVPVIDSANGKINPYGQVGKDIELVTDMREQYSSIAGGGLNFNVDIFFPVPGSPLPPAVITSFTPQFNIQNSRYRSVAMLKVIQRYGIIDSVVHIDKGSKISTRNLVWDGETGQVLVTQTQNEFNDPIYQFQYPAHWAYSGVGPAYKNIDAQLHKVCIHGGRMVKVNGLSSVNKIDERIFESGDEVLIENPPSFHVFEGCRDPHVATESPASPDRKVWVVDRGKLTGNKEIYFIRRNGIEYTGHDIDIRVIRSGRRNIGSAPVGSVVSLKSPIRVVDGQQRVVIDSTIDVVATGAAVMKDVWPVENRLYKVSTCDSTDVAVDTTIYADTTALVKRWLTTNGLVTTEVLNGIYPSYGNFTANRALADLGGSIKHDFTTRGIAKFNFDFIPGHAIIDSAKLMLYAKAPDNLWPSIYYELVDDAHIPGINQSELLHITQPWTSSTTLQQTNSIVTQANKATLAASVSGCQDYTANISGMVQSMLERPDSNHGILFKLINPDSLELHYTKTFVNHMSFCGSGDTTMAMSGCHACTPMTLRLKYHYRKDTCTTDCESVFDKPINPYTQGVWGIWRGSRSYVYYDRRKESDPLQPTNVRTNGVIRNFIPYWTMSNTGITATGDDYRWVWNSEITRFNRRGLETENHDPLGRFNSGLYGYNNTLPIAVAQNARHREIAFDGFEDYSFATDSCTIDCPLPRHLDFSAYKDSIVTTQKHTGKASLRLGAGSNASVGVQVKAGDDGLSPAVNFSTGMAAGFCKYFESITTSTGAVYPGFMPLPGKKMVVSAWVKEDKDCKCLSYTGNKIEFLFYKEGDSLSKAQVFSSGNIIEGWQRYDDTLSIPADADSMVVRLRNTTDVPVYFDDFRLHPYNSNMKSFVYHPTNLRLLADLDENNFASFYEYDDEGTLIRTKKETERGVKTIAETRSAVRKTDE